MTIRLYRRVRTGTHGVVYRMRRSGALFIAGAWLVAAALAGELAVVWHPGVAAASPTTGRTTTTAGGVRTDPTRPAAGTPCAPSARACMVISTHQAWLTDGAGHIVYGPVAARAGMSRAPTPIGTFRVLSKDAHYYSREFDAPMPFAVFFYPGDAFHAGNTGVSSNGCIHLSWAAAQRFFTSLDIGDEVQIRQH